jgi:hypothetical protein
VVRRLTGLLSGITYMAVGWLTAIMDTIQLFTTELTFNLGWKLVGAALLAAGVSYTVWSGVRHPAGFTPFDWMIYGVHAAGLGLIAIGGIVPPLRAPIAYLTMFQGAWLAGLYMGDFFFATGASHDLPLLIGNVLLTVPNIVSPLKLFPTDTLLPAVVPISDYVFRMGSGVAFMADTGIHWNDK